MGATVRRMTTPNAAARVSRWSLTHAGNRVGLSVLVAWLTWMVSDVPVLALLAGVVLYALITAVVSVRR